MTERPEQDDFGGFDTSAGVMAFIHQKCGDDGLRQLLAEIGPDRDSLLKDAAELEAIGLFAVASIVAEIAANTPEPTCPFPEGSANFRDWQRRYSNAGGFIPEDQRWWLD